MPQQIVWKCNRCGKETRDDGRAGWFDLSQKQLGGFDRLRNEVKLRDGVYFCSLLCVSEWATKAVIVSRELLASVRTASEPRGEIKSPAIPELYI